MARQQLSLKQLAINKDNSTIVIVVALTTFVTIFSIVAIKSLLAQSSYQSKVIKQKESAVKQLNTNASEVKKLNASYQAFASQDENILKGSRVGNGDLDGDNARIILDALPSKYDFPALTTSLEKAFKGYKVTSISGTDDALAQSETEATAKPEAKEMPFSMEVAVKQENATAMMQVFQKSIRPIQIDKLSLAGDATEVRYTINAKTYYQPSKTFNVTTEKVKK